MHKSIINLVTILLFMGWAILYSMNAAINAPTFHLDGAFQTASGLFRLDSGQFPGKDFYPYLGIGPLFSLYPAFKAFGANLSASVFSAQLMTLVFAWLSWSILWQLIFRPKSFVTALAAGAFLLACCIVIDLPPLLRDAIAFASNPGNSLRPIRSVAPYLAVSIYYFFLLRTNSFQIRILLSGIVTAAILLWSNDFAIPTAGLFIFLIASDILGNKGLKWKYGTLYLSSFLFFLVVLLSLFTQGHPLEFLRYNYIDVRADQWWFFGPYNESARIFEPNQIIGVILNEATFPLTVLALAVIVAIKTRSIEHILLAWIGLVLLCGGTLASVGGHLDQYYWPFRHWGVITSVFAVLKLVFSMIGRLATPSARALVVLRVSPALIASTALLAIAALVLRQYRTDLDAAKTDPDRFYVSELGAYLGREWKDYIALARSANAQNVAEEYWGLWSATRKSLPAWPVDSAIHALGSTRDVAGEALTNAELVISTRNSAAPRWQPWSLSQNFWFYDELLKNWTPDELSPTTVVWHKNKNARPRKAIECHLSDDKKAILLNIKEPGFYRVEIDYTFTGKGRHLTFIRNNLSYAAGAKGYVSVNPEGSRAIFPAYLSQKPAASLDLRVVGSGRYALDVRSCAASEITLVNDEVLKAPTKIFWFS